MAIVNVNIKNCNCCGSGSGVGYGSDSGNDIFDGEPTNSTDTPPKGFSTSEVDSRACKTAIWLYDWVLGWFDALIDQSWLIENLISILSTNAAKNILIPPLKKAISYVVGIVASAIGTPGLSPDDPLTFVIAAGIAETVIDRAISGLTGSMIIEAKTTLQAKRAEFICNIARGGTPFGSQEQLFKWATLTFPLPVAGFIDGLCKVFYNLAYYTADWWPGFEDEISGITETCCGGLTDGTPITPGSAQACSGANFILDNLVTTLTTADSYVQEYSRTTYNSVTATESLMLSNVQSAFSVPDNVQNKAWSFPLMQAELARYMWAKLGGDSWLTPGVGVNTWEMGRLGAHLQTEIAICELRDCETAQAAYELLSGAIDAWLAANVTDQDLVNHIRLFCQGLIHPSGAYIGVLFAESADLAGFAGSSDCSECVNDIQLIFGVGSVQFGGNRTIESAATVGGKHTLQFTYPDCSYGHFSLTIVSHTSPTGQARGLTQCINGNPTTDHTSPFITGTFTISGMYFQANEAFSIVCAIEELT